MPFCMPNCTKYAKQVVKSKSEKPSWVVDSIVIERFGADWVDNSIFIVSLMLLLLLLR